MCEWNGILIFKSCHEKKKTFVVVIPKVTSFWFGMKLREYCIGNSLDSGPDGDAVSAERSPKSECSLGLYIPSGLLKCWLDTEIQPMVLDSSDGLLNKIGLNFRGPLHGHMTPIGY